MVWNNGGTATIWQMSTLGFHRPPGPQVGPAAGSGHYRLTSPTPIT